MSRLAPTPRQRDALEAIRAYQAANKGTSPTYRELAAMLGVSMCTTHERVRAMVGRGIVRVVPGKSRGIEIIEDRRAVKVREALRLLRAMSRGGEAPMPAVNLTIELLEAATQ